MAVQRIIRRLRDRFADPPRATAAAAGRLPQPPPRVDQTRRPRPDAQQYSKQRRIVGKYRRMNITCRPAIIQFNGYSGQSNEENELNVMLI